MKVEDLTLSCAECDGEIGEAEVEALIDGWIRLLKWIAAARAFAAIDAEEARAGANP